jgi:hypothetical protein
MKIDSLTTRKYAMTHTAKRMSIEGGFKFMFLGQSGGHSKAQQNIDAQYKANSIIKESCYGGTADLIKTGFNAWKASAPQILKHFISTSIRLGIKNLKILIKLELKI